MAKYDIGSVKNIRFARYGGLSSVNQLGYDSKMPDFHSPPARRGFYCFVWPFYEMFLLGAPETKDPYIAGAKFSYVRDRQGNIITEKHPDYQRLSEMNDYSNKYWTTESKEWKDFKKKHNWPLWRCGETKEYNRLTESLEATWKLECDHLPKLVLVEKPRPRIFEHRGLLWHHLSEQSEPRQVLARKGEWVKSTVEDYRTMLEKEMHRARRDTMKFMTAIDTNYKLMPSSKSPFRMSGKDHLECFIEKL